MNLRALDGAAAKAIAPRVWPCYETVFADFPDLDAWRSDMFGRHADRSGFRLVVAEEPDRDTREASPVVGFVWGHVGERGQFWSDLLARTLPPEVTDTWVGGHFEVVSLGVLPQHRGHGLGGRLMDLLLDGIDRRCLLGTSTDPADPAPHLYKQSGWRTLGLLDTERQVMGLDRSTPSK